MGVTEDGVPTAQQPAATMGAFNHTVGIQKAGVILAINRNHRAAIFRAADFGIVGDWNEYLPAVVEAIRPVLAEPGLA